MADRLLIIEQLFCFFKILLRWSIATFLFMRGRFALLMLDSVVDVLLLVDIDVDIYVNIQV